MSCSDLAGVALHGWPVWPQVFLQTLWDVCLLDITSTLKNVSGKAGAKVKTGPVRGPRCVSVLYLKKSKSCQVWLNDTIFVQAHFQFRIHPAPAKIDDVQLCWHNGSTL